VRNLREFERSVTVTTDTDLKMSPVVVDFLGKKRAEMKRAKNVQLLEKKRDVIEGRNVLVYRGVPYVRYNAR
jgi:hypothetical protein|tara:strand:+ start:899 stop:1114 length:216 start_codon:yes stop_codon:yes gene_type:complete